MKKLLLTILLLCIPLKTFAVNINEYLNKSYVGVSYEEGMNSNLPFLIAFANSNDIFSIMKFAPIGEMVYNEFNGKFNFCIINTKIKENKNFYKEFGLNEKPPVLLVINPITQIFYLINKKYYTKESLKLILDRYYEEITQQKSSEN